MRHVQLVIASVSLGPRVLPIRHGTLQVVERHDHLDWEVVLHTIDHEPVAHDVHPLTMRVVTGADEAGRLVTADVSGDAIFVRGIDTTIVFRGHGELVGFDRATLG